MSLCPDCAAIYSPHGGGHCRARYGGCCQTFSNDPTAEAHMTSHHPLVCLTSEQMLGKGWRLTDRGWTKYAPMPEAQKAARKAKWGR